MASRWQFGSVPIYVSEQEKNREIKRAELFVLDATSSVYQFFGTGSKHITIKGIVLSASNYDTLDGYSTSDSAQTFITPFGNISSVKIHKIKGDSIKYAGGVVDGTVLDAYVTDVIAVELELILP